MKIMITVFNRFTAVSAPGKRADVHVCLGIEGEAAHPFGFIADSIRRMDINEKTSSVCTIFFRLALSHLFQTQAHLVEFADCPHCWQPVTIADCVFMFLRRLPFNWPGYRHWTK